MPAVCASLGAGLDSIARPPSNDNESMFQSHSSTITHDANAGNLRESALPIVACWLSFLGRLVLEPTQSDEAS